MVTLASDESELPGRVPRPGLRLGTEPHPHGVSVEKFFDHQHPAGTLHAVKPDESQAFCGVEVVPWEDTQWPPAVGSECLECEQLIAAFGPEGPPPRPAGMEHRSTDRSPHHDGSHHDGSQQDATDPSSDRRSPSLATADETTRERLLARAHGIFNIAGGLWPLLHMGSFEAVLGPKTDRWLVKAVGGLLIGNGVAQFQAAASSDGLASARRIGVGTALALGVIDVVYACAGRISRMYLLDAVLEGGWVLAWLWSSRPRPVTGA